MTNQLPPGRLIVLDAFAADTQPHEVVLVHDSYTLGRAPTCQIVVQRSLVSRLHARIERNGPRYILHDAGSANGTFVNGRSITQPHLLSDQDEIGLGSPAGVLRFLDADPTFIPGSRLRYDERTMAFSISGQPLDLPPTQFRLLRHLYDNLGSVCTRESCAQAIWGREYDPGLDADALDRVVTNLRAQIRQLAPDAELITTRRGIGYELTL
jgi:DNA-binding response OmpR family regulator